jgi:hypothetical protein
VTERLEAQSSKSRQTHALLDMKNPPKVKGAGER